MATTQSLITLISLLEERSISTPDRSPTILELPTMFQVARLVGATLKEVIETSSPDHPTAESKFRASVIVGDQIKANLSVGMPLDLQIYETDRFAVSDQPRVEADDPYFQEISQGWGDALRAALMQLPSYTRS